MGLKKTLKDTLPFILTIGGFIGLVSAFVLTLEKIALLKDPAHQLSCSLNPVLSCGSIIMSDQASVFGFANPLIGLVGFSVVITVGMALFAGATFKRWFWLGLQTGTIFGLAFVHWLMYQSYFTLEALCLYCIIVWSITIPIFYYTTLYNLREGHIKTPTSLKSKVAFIHRHHGDILLAWYVLVIGTTAIKFWYYWQTLI